MNNFSQYRLTAAEMREKGVVSAPDRLTGTAQENKALFDRLVRESVSVRFNELLDALELRAASLGRGANLLDNWYFIGGGSQQGGGQFPINQRGQASYSGVGYTVDRWRLYRNDGQLKVLSNGLELTTTTVGSAANAIRQKLEQPLPSGTYTFSALIDQVGGGGGNTWSEILFRDGNNTFLNASASTEGTGVQLISCTYTGSVAQTFDVNTKQSSAGVTKCKIIAVKLECGDTQTLARNTGTVANPQWVLNDPPPNYQQELAKCQRYFQVFRTQALRPTYGIDFRPPMATDEPTLGSFVKDTVTYYTASSET